MKEKEFDNLIRTRLRNHESPVPAGVWERITLKGKKQRKGFAPRLYVLTIVLLLIGLGGLFYSSYLHYQSKGESVVNKNNSTNTSVDTKNLIQPNNKTNNVSIANATRYVDPVVTESPVRKEHRQEKKLPAKKEKVKKLSTDTQKVQRSGGDLVVNNRASVSSSEKNETPGNIIKKTAGENNASKSDAPTNAEMQPVQSGSDKFSVELFTSPSVPVNSINSDNRSYEQALKNASSMKLSYTIGLRFSYAVSKKVSAKTGVQYTQVNEKMNFKDSAGGNFSSTNRYRNIGVPLVLGYKIVSKNNLDIYVNTGIILNVASRYEGIIPSESGQPIDIKNNDVYNTNASADLYLGINLSKKMNDRTDFFAEPWLNYRFKNMVSHFYSFDQKINTLGLSFGVRYRLYKEEMPR
jgi:opacity protein-like surface antigen